MGHSTIIIDNQIDRLIGESLSSTTDTALNQFRQKCATVSTNIQSTASEFTVQLMHDLLHSIENWLTGAHVSDENFIEFLEGYDRELDQYV